MQTSETEAKWMQQHPAMLLFGMASIVRSTILPLILGLTGGESSLTFLIIALIMGVLGFVALLLKFFSYRYYVDLSHIYIREGVVSKKVRTIPVKRIHNINTRQSLVARVLGVVRLDIETAGGGAAEASFTALSAPAAEYVQELVRRGKQEDASVQETAAPQEPEERPIHQVSMKDLLVAGATTNRLGVILMALAVVVEHTDGYFERLPGWIQDGADQASALQNQSPLLLVALGFSVFAGLLLLAWLISIGTALVQWYRFRVTEKGSDLKIRTGLFTLREFTMPKGKIQALQARTSAIRRPFNLVQIRVCSAGHVGVQGGDRMETDLLVPICRKDMVGYFVKTVWPEAVWEKVTWLPVHPYTRLRQFRILSMLCVAAFIAGMLFLEFANRDAILVTSLFLAVPLCWAISHLTYKQTAYAFEGNHLYIKTGFIGLHFWAIPISRIQALAVTQSPFQRRRNLASLVVDVAGSPGREAVTPNIPLEDAWRLFNRLGHPEVVAQTRDEALKATENVETMIPSEAPVSGANEYQGDPA